MSQLTKKEQVLTDFRKVLLIFKKFFFLEKSKVHGNNLVQFLHVDDQNTINFVFITWEMVEKMRTDVDRLLLVLKMKKMCRYILP